jgi:hypothetical protein
MKWHYHVIVMQVLHQSMSDEAKLRHLVPAPFLSAGDIVAGSNEHLHLLDIVEVLNEMVSLGDVECFKREEGMGYRLSLDGREVAANMKFKDLETKGPQKPAIWPTVKDLLTREGPTDNLAAA